MEKYNSDQYQYSSENQANESNPYDNLIDEHSEGLRSWNSL